MKIEKSVVSNAYVKDLGMNAIGISYILRYYLYALHILVLLFEEIRNFRELTNFIASKH